MSIIIFYNFWRQQKPKTKIKQANKQKQKPIKKTKIKNKKKQKQQKTNQHKTKTKHPLPPHQRKKYTPPPRTLNGRSLIRQYHKALLYHVT